MTREHVASLIVLALFVCVMWLMWEAK